MAEHRARKRFGQNFLCDTGVIRRIVDAIAPRETDHVVEIGPGLGALTVPLLERLPRMDVVEIDRDLIARLASGPLRDRLTIHATDALEFDFASLGASLRVVGNLPYNISTPLLFHLAEFAGAIRDMTFMLQKEVVMRMVAQPGEADYGRLSVMLQYRFRLGWLFDVPPESFRPAPKVMSSIVRMVPRVAGELAATDEEMLGAIVAAAFAQRRKTLRNTLGHYLGEGDFVSLGIDPGMRAERLGVDDYVRVANHCCARGTQ